MAPDSLQAVVLRLLCCLRTRLRTMGLLNIISSIKDRAEKFLNEKNVVTDILGKMEEKTGIKKKVIALGTCDLIF